MFFCFFAQRSSHLLTTRFFPCVFVVFRKLETQQRGHRAGSRSRRTSSATTGRTTSDLHSPERHEAYRTKRIRAETSKAGHQGAAPNEPPTRLPPRRFAPGRFYFVWVTSESPLLSAELAFIVCCSGASRVRLGTNLRLRILNTTSLRCVFFIFGEGFLGEKVFSL